MRLKYFHHGQKLNSEIKKIIGSDSINIDLNEF